MELDRLIYALSHHQGPFPRGPVEEAIQRQEEITPALLEMIAWTDRTADKGEPPEDYMGHLMACFLLAQFREPRAYRPIVKLFSPTRVVVMDIFDDFVTESLAMVLASVFDGDWEPLKGMVVDGFTDEYVRAAALEAFAALVGQGVLTRDEVMAYYRSLFHGGLAPEQSFVWDALASCACDLYPREVETEIRQCFANGLLDPGFMDLAWFEESLAKGEATQLSELAADPHRQFVTDTVEMFSRWVWFTDPEYWPASVHRGKPGRNDPCPCGSGKKFKNCCGRKA